MDAWMDACVDVTHGGSDATPEYKVVLHNQAGARLGPFTTIYLCMCRSLALSVADSRYMYNYCTYFTVGL